MAPDPSATRERLIAAAERLFAEHSIDGVSLRQINAAAEQRNSTALQYHFGGRNGLIRAVLAKHHDPIERRRHALLDDYERAYPDGGGTDVADRPERMRILAGALVRPVAAELADRESGRAFVRIMAQLVNKPSIPRDDPTMSDPADSVYRWRHVVETLLPEVSAHRLHVRFTAVRLTYIELARRAEQTKTSDDRLFTSHLIDLVTAVLLTEPSVETETVLEATEARRAARRGSSTRT